MSTDSLNVDSRTRDRIVKASVELQMPEEVYEERKQKWNSSSFYGKFCSQNKRQRNKPTTQGSRLTGVIAL